MDDLIELDYFKLIKEERRLPAASSPERLRLAVLGDASTQSLVKLLRVLLARLGVEAEIWEGSFDTVETEAFNPSADLYSFRPAAVVIASSLGAYRRRYYTDAGDRSQFAHQTAA